MMSQLTKPPSPYTKEERKQMVKEFHKKREAELNAKQPKSKPMPILKYINTMNSLYGNGYDESEGPGYIPPEEKKDILKSIPVSPLVKEEERFNDKILKRDKYEPKKIIKKETKMADLDNLPPWFLKNLDDLILEYQEDIGDRPRTLNDLEKWYRNKHGTTKLKSKEKEIRVAEKPKPKPLAPQWDWRLSDWTDLFDEDAPPPPPEDIEKVLNIKKREVEGLEAFLNLHKRST